VFLSSGAPYARRTQDLGLPVRHEKHAQNHRLSGMLKRVPRAATGKKDAAA